MVKSIYYTLKPCMPRKLQLFIRRKFILYKRERCRDIWPIDKFAGEPPLNWQSWPERKKFALVLTHDVEMDEGQSKCMNLSQVEEGYGLLSSFNFVPERYAVSPVLRLYLENRGFEIGVHDLNHDGKLFSSEKMFESRMPRINRYLKEWNAVGFRAGAMHHNLEWIGKLNIEYDCSTFDTDPFEPQPDGVKTIFPFWVPNMNGGFAELPYTLPQDFTLFILMRMDGCEIWKRKLDWIAEKGGMVLVNTHPDYMYFNDSEYGDDKYSVEIYREFLEYIYKRYNGQYWNALPRELASFVKDINSEDVSINRID
ncbi:MAG: hypothetical protein Q4F84_01370 [Fibrobacter sp.]|nr:hypothetical protein [Fibrobacter sp.]